MYQTYYVPIYSWGKDSDDHNGSTSGTTLYLSLQDLYGFEPEAVGFFEVSGKMPTKREFKKQHESKFELTESQIENWLEASLCGRRYKALAVSGHELDTQEFIKDLIEDLKSQ